MTSDGELVKDYLKTLEGELLDLIPAITCPAPADARS